MIFNINFRLSFCIIFFIVYFYFFSFNHYRHFLCIFLRSYHSKVQIVQRMDVTLFTNKVCMTKNFQILHRGHSSIMQAVMVKRCPVPFFLRGRQNSHDNSNVSIK